MDRQRDYCSNDNNYIRTGIRIYLQPIKEKMSGFNATKTSTYEFLSTDKDVKVNFDSVQFDTNGYFSTSTDVATVQEAGIYTVTVGVQIDQNFNTSDVNGEVNVKLNAANYNLFTQVVNYNSNDMITISATYIAELNVGDKLWVMFDPPSNVTQHKIIILPGSWFGMVKH